MKFLTGIYRAVILRRRKIGFSCFLLIPYANMASCKLRVSLSGLEISAADLAAIFLLLPANVAAPPRFGPFCALPFLSAPPAFSSAFLRACTPQWPNHWPFVFLQRFRSRLARIVEGFNYVLHFAEVIRSCAGSAFSSPSCAFCACLYGIRSFFSRPLSGYLL